MPPSSTKACTQVMGPKKQTAMNNSVAAIIWM